MCLVKKKKNDDNVIIMVTTMTIFLGNFLTTHEKRGYYQYLLNKIYSNSNYFKK